MILTQSSRDYFEKKRRFAILEVPIWNATDRTVILSHWYKLVYLSQLHDMQLVPEGWRHFHWKTWCYFRNFFSRIREVIWKAPKMWKMILSCDSICIIIWNAQKNEEFHFRFLFCFKIDHVLIVRNAPLFNVRNIWNASFFLFDSEMGKWGFSNISSIRKWGISNNYHVINFETEKESKMKFFASGAF